MHRTARINTPVWIAAGAIAIVLAGCAGNNERAGSVRTIGLADFASAGPATQESSPDEAAREAAAEVTDRPADFRDDEPASNRTAAGTQLPSPGSEAAANSERDDPVWPEEAGGVGTRATVAPADDELDNLTDSRAATSGESALEQIIVDSMVGQVNGRPIFADSFFEPIEDRLTAISQRTSRREFVSYASEVVRQHLREILLNELFLAEAESQLTSEQQKGLFAFMRAMREEEIARGGGARAAADERMREREGVTVEEYIAASRDMMLLRELQRRKIQPRVIVSWRDIEREYQRRYNEYNKPATAKISRIRLSTESESEVIDEVKQRLDAGEPFAEVAESTGHEDGGAWQVFTLGDDGLAGIPLSEHLRERVVDLGVGETSEPFEVGRSTWWLHLAEIDQPEGRPLYDPDVQRELSNYLHNRRFNEEMNKYISRLMDHGIHDQFDEMHERLVVIAVQRYGP